MSDRKAFTVGVRHQALGRQAPFDDDIVTVLSLG
jgi:hypothetical protein